MYQPPAPAIIQPPAPTANARANAATLTQSPFLPAGLAAPCDSAVRVAGSSTKRGGVGAVDMGGGAVGRGVVGFGAADAVPRRGRKMVGAKVAGSADTHSMQYLANGRLSVPQLGHVVDIRPALAGPALHGER